MYGLFCFRPHPFSDGIHPETLSAQLVGRLRRRRCLGSPLCHFDNLKLLPCVGARTGSLCDVAIFVFIHIRQYTNAVPNVSGLWGKLKNGMLNTEYLIMSV